MRSRLGRVMNFVRHLWGLPRVPLTPFAGRAQIPADLAGHGPVNAALSVDSQLSNTLSISIM